MMRLFSNLDTTTDCHRQLTSLKHNIFNDFNSKSAWHKTLTIYIDNIQLKRKVYFLILSIIVNWLVYPPDVNTAIVTANCNTGIQNGTHDKSPKL